MKSWAELFPEGREIYYEGDDPLGFVLEMKSRFDFDPENHGWTEGISGYRFHCPSALLDKIYGNPKYPLGS